MNRGEAQDLSRATSPLFSPYCRVHKSNSAVVRHIFSTQEGGHSKIDAIAVNALERRLAHYVPRRHGPQVEECADIYIQVVIELEAAVGANSSYHQRLEEKQGLQCRLPCRPVATSSKVRVFWESGGAQNLRLLTGQTPGIPVSAARCGQNRGGSVRS